MANVLEVYRCDVCRMVVEVVGEGAGRLVCCAQPMRRLDESEASASKETHTPVLDKVEGGYAVRFDKPLHPMDPDHRIDWVELIAGESTERKFLRPGDEPEVTFATDAENVNARAYCNLHGLWKSE